MSFTSSNAQELKEFGYTIVKSVVSDDYLSRAVNEINDWLVETAEVPRHQLGVASGRKPTNWPFTLHGIFKHYGIGHLQSLWDIRQHAPVITACCDAYRCMGAVIDPIVSFDGVCVMHSYSMNSISRMRSQLHLDQTNKWCLTSRNSHFMGSPHDFQTIQGLIPLKDMSPATGTFRVLEGSHKYHQTACGMNDKSFNISDECYTYLTNNGCNDVKITAKAGDYVLWDSRLVHAAAVPVSPSNDWRYVFYVTYGDKSRAKAYQLRKREKAFNDLRMTGHLTEHVKLNPKEPRKSYSARNIEYLSTRPTVTKTHLIA